MPSSLSLAIFASLVAITTSQPLTNVTIAVTEGYSNHGNASLFCLKTRWYHIVTFFVVNYVAHTATVRSRPGQKLYHTVRDVILALAFPSSGLLRALSAFWQVSWPFETGDVKAFRAEALWVVEHNPVGDDVASTATKICDTSDEKPSSIEEKLRKAWLRMKSNLCNINSNPRNVHGICELPPNYIIRPLATGSKILTKAGKQPGDVELTSSYSFTKATAAIIQIVLASITLYRSRGDQLRRFGYATFSLTIVPYLIMSFVNLFAAVLVPEYPTVFLVLSKASDAAIVEGGRVEGAVARLLEIESRDASKDVNSSDDTGSDSDGSNQKRDNDTTQQRGIKALVLEISQRRRWLKILSSVFAIAIIGGVSMGIIGWLSGFKIGQSTLAQRTWTMSWLCVGIVMGTYFEIVFNYTARHVEGKKFKFFIDYTPAERLLGYKVPWKRALTQIVGIAFIMTPAVGGFVVVAQMLLSYGSCTYIR